MANLGVVAAFLVVVVSFSGCSTSGELAPEDVNIVTDPNDFSYLENQTARAHVHDYWNGLDRIVIADESFYCGGITLSDPNICSYRPDSPIPLGTGMVELTIAWTENADVNQPSYYESVELWVKTAAAQDPEPFGIIGNGDRLTIDTTNEDADLPHQRLSAWEFYLYTWGDRDAPYPLTAKSFYADVDIFVEAVRTLDIPLFAGHPDIWQNRTAIPLVADYRYPADGDDEVRIGTGGTNFAAEGDDRRIRPMEGAIIPTDAAYVEVILEQAYAETSDRAHLYYHGAADREFLALEAVEDTGTRLVYHIPIAGDGDSPYALQSMWEFYTAFGDAPGPGQGVVYKGSYTVEATVYKEPAAEL